MKAVLDLQLHYTTHYKSFLCESQRLYFTFFTVS